MDETITRIDLMNIEEIRKFSDEISSKIHFDYDLKKSNWFNIGGQAKVYFRPDSLPDLILFLKKFGEKEKVHILGAGLSDIVALGCRIAPGDVLARVHAARLEQAEVTADRIRAAIRLSAGAPELAPLICDRIMR